MSTQTERRTVRYRAPQSETIELLDVEYDVILNDEEIRGRMLSAALRNQSNQCTLGPVTVKIRSRAEVTDRPARAETPNLSMAGLP